MTSDAELLESRSQDQQDQRANSFRPRRLLTTYQYRTYQPTDLSIFSSFDQPYLQFDRATNRFRHLTPEKLGQCKSYRKGNVPGVIIYMIPGNPGLIEFYDRFLLELTNNFDRLGGCEIVCSAHVGHSIRYNSNFDLRFLENFKIFSPNRNPTLADQVEYHTEVVGKILTDGIGDSKKTKLVLIGHSVGGYIASKVLERFPDRVTRMIGLFPTLSNIAHSPKGRRLTPLFSPILLPFINILQIIFNAILPKTLLCHLIIFVYNFANSSPKPTKVDPSIKSKISKSNLMIILDFILNINCVTAVLTMARSEMASILDLDQKFIERFHQKCTLIWTTYGKDEWVAEEEIIKIIEHLDNYIGPDSSTNHVWKRTPKPVRDDSFTLTDPVHRLPYWKRMGEGVTHDYCLEYNEVMAKECTLIIEKSLT